MSQVSIIDIEGTHPQIPTQFDANIGFAIPIANTLEIFGDTTLAGTSPVHTEGSGNNITTYVQISQAIAAADATKIGLAAFDSSMFTVDADGFVSLVGGAVGIDSLTGDDGVVVGGDAAGNVNLVGSVVANATNAKPLYFDGTEAANTQTLEIQVSTTLPLAPSDTNDAGICSFNSLQFDVDANGYVTLAGGSAAVDSNTGDDGVTVFPDVAGNFNWIGEAVANATHAKPIFFKDSATANALDLDVQVGAAITGAPADKNDAGLVSFDDTSFDVDTNGYVTLVGGGFTWNDVSGAFSPLKNNGYFVTGTATGTLPAAPAQGDTIKFFVDHATQDLTIDAPGTQIIRFGSTVSAAGGTAVSTAQGDSVELTYRASDTCWCAIGGFTGNWTIT